MDAICVEIYNFKMRVLIRRYIFFIVLSITIGASSSDRIILTNSGPIRGVDLSTANSEVEAFLGIPYAEPPIGELRFGRPVPIRPWDDVYNATKKPYPCSQNSTQKFYWTPDLEFMSEDCLYLNIWVPNMSKGTRGMTTMVWIHGGAFNIGSSDMDVYDGASLAAYGDVIVVSLNYRLGIFGFMTSPSDDAKGNMGIYDQVMAMQWLKENIPAFGGDSEEIVLFGESAGAMSISVHLISPLTRNLFKRAIMASGTGITPMTRDGTNAHIKTSNNIAKMVGCADRQKNITTDPQLVVDCLKRVSYLELTRAEGLIMKSNPITYFPRWGDELMPIDMPDAMREFRYKNTEVLMGVNQDEGSFFITAGLPEYFGIYGNGGMQSINKRMAKTLIQGMFKVVGQSKPRDIADFYVRNAGNETTDNLRKAVYHSVGDYIIGCSAIFFSDFYSRNLNKVYFYVFTHRPSTAMMANWTGSTHFDEVQYTFGNSLVGNFTDQEEILSRRIMDRWIQFAKYGNPNLEGEVKWPPYTHRFPVYLEIDVNETVQKHPLDERCEFWRDRFGASLNTSEAAEPLIDTPDSSSSATKYALLPLTIVQLLMLFSILLVKL